MENLTSPMKQRQSVKNVSAVFASLSALPLCRSPAYCNFDLAWFLLPVANFRNILKSLIFGGAASQSGNIPLNCISLTQFTNLSLPLSSLCWTLFCHLVNISNSTDPKELGLHSCHLSTTDCDIFTCFTCVSQRG